MTAAEHAAEKGAVRRERKDKVAHANIVCYGTNGSLRCWRSEAVRHTSVLEKKKEAAAETEGNIEKKTVVEAETREMRL